jgi:hypothetical protein
VRYIDSGVLLKKHCVAFILVKNTTTSIGYIENADALDIAKHAFCQLPIATTGLWDPFK